MKKLGMLTHSGKEFGRVVREIQTRFDRLQHEHPSVTFQDIDVACGVFGKFWVVLVYTYDDTPLVEHSPTVAEWKPRYIGDYPPTLSS